jgi:microcystin-dependent protein
VTLLASELPAHSHVLALPAVTTAATSDQAAGNLPAVQRENAYSDRGTPVEMFPNALSPAFAGGPHNNMQPYLTLTFIIALQGVFPPRS